jgi:hypothetical protein
MEKWWFNITSTGTAGYKVINGSITADTKKRGSE